MPKENTLVYDTSNYQKFYLFFIINYNSGDI